MKKLIACILMTLFISSISTAAEKPFNLNFALSDPATHYEVKGVYGVWAKEVEKRTGGRVKVRLYPGQTLGKQNEQFDLVLRGAAQLTIMVGTQYPGRFPLTDVFNLPFLIPPDGPGSPGKEIRDMVYAKYLIPLYFKDVKVLWNGRYQPNVIHMAKDPVRKLEDIKGKVIGFPGGRLFPAYIKTIGASPIQAPSPDVYTMLEKGVIDGMIFPFETQLAFKLSDVAKFVTMTNQGSASKCLIMRKETWESFSPDIQKTIEDLNPWTEELMFKVNQGAFQKISQLSKKVGVEMIELSPAERERWTQAAKSVELEWVAEMDAKGLPGTALYNDIKKMIGEN